MNKINMSNIRDFAKSLLFENNINEWSGRPDDGQYIQNTRQGGAINSPMIDGDNNYHSIKDEDPEEDEELMKSFTETPNGYPLSSDDIVPINAEDKDFKSLGIQKTNDVDTSDIPQNKVSLKNKILKSTNSLDFATNKEFASFWKEFEELINKNK